MGLIRKQHFIFKGDTRDDALLIGSHGDASILIRGNFELSGIVYCPKYTLTLTIDGTGTVAFRGICNRVVIKRMSGSAIFDLRDLTCKELRCESVKKNSKVLAGKTRVVSKANLFDDAILQLTDKPLITSASLSGKARIIHGDTNVEVLV